MNGKFIGVRLLGLTFCDVIRTYNLVKLKAKILIPMRWTYPFGCSTECLFETSREV